jgi:hypothetical protein
MRASILILATAGGLASPALAEVRAIPVGNGLTLRPLADARLRYEHVDQEGFARNADALTARLRAGLEATAGSFALLGEAEAALAPVERYNSGTNRKSLFPTVADPQNIELNRLQLQYRTTPDTILTAGRQRIALDDQRFIGSVGWRQNEQTFDAVRLEVRKLGPITADITYSWSTRTIFGIEARDLPPAAANKQAIGGDNVFANAGVKLGPVVAKGFAYLIDQDEPGRRQFSSQTYGVKLAGAIPLSDLTRLDIAASYARQSEWRNNPGDYAANYWLIEAGTSLAGFGVTAGYEVLGVKRGGSFQTPLATLHKFNGWADKFLVTPANGLRDLYVTVGRKMPVVAMLPGLNGSVTWHRFDSDRLGRAYGDEWDAQIGFRLRGTGVLLKYAAYDRAGAADFAGDADTDKFWLQLEWTV